MADTIVLGAGIVGVSTALALQARGCEVVLVDRAGIGRETSFGNAGAIQSEAVEPYAFPRSLSTLVKIAFKRSRDVNWHFSALREHVDPLVRYWRQSSPARHRQASAVYSRLIEQSADAHEPLIKAAGVEALIERNGYRWVFRSADRFDAACHAVSKLAERYGIDYTIETAEELARAEKGLKIGLAGSIHYKGVMTCLSPGGLTAGYGRLFQARGGTFAYGDACSLTQNGTGWRVQAEDGHYTATRVVVALGPWSAQLVSRFGYTIPLFRKRGYHRHYPVENGPRQSMLDAERGVVLARMAQGLRLTTGAEITQHDAAVDWRQIDQAEGAARELFEIGAPIEVMPWVGHRPCLPDMLPVLGEAKYHKGLWLHFGHGHQGFTAGPTTAEILADLMSGRPSEFADSLSPNRFI